MAEWTHTLKKPRWYQLSQCVEAHGWHHLAPYFWDCNKGTLHACVQAGAQAVDCSWRQIKDGIELTVVSQHKLSKPEEDQLRHMSRYSLMLDVKTGSLHKTAREHGDDFASLVSNGHGRLLRSGSIWEDAAKTLFTTNCSWALTCKMAESLCKIHPLRSPQGRQPFPMPQVIKQLDAQRLQDEHPLGYRAESFHALALQFCDQGLGKNLGKLDGEALRDEITQWHGFGPYAAQHLAVLLEHFDAIPVDSIIKAYVKERWPRRKGSSRAIIDKAYASWGEHAWWGLQLDRRLHRISEQSDEQSQD